MTTDADADAGGGSGSALSGALSGARRSRRRLGLRYGVREGACASGRCALHYVAVAMIGSPNFTVAVESPLREALQGR